VVEVQLDLVGRRGDRLSTRVLQLLNEVLVRLLGKTAALLSVKVHIVHIERRGRQGLDSLRGRARGRGAAAERGGSLADRVVVAAVDELLKLHIDAHLVVLESDQRDGKTGVAAEPELERDVQRLGRRTCAGSARVRQLRASARAIQNKALGILEKHKVVGVANHVVKSSRRTNILRQLGPDLHPVTILTVNALTADLKLHNLDEAVANRVEPAEALDRCLTSGTQVHCGQHHLDVRAVHQVGIAVDNGRHTLVEVGLAVERHLNGLHGEVRVALVQNLPEGDLGIARNINILRTIAHELHQTTCHIVMLHCNIFFGGSNWTRSVFL